MAFVWGDKKDITRAIATFDRGIITLVKHVQNNYQSFH